MLIVLIGLILKLKIFFTCLSNQIMVVLLQIQVNIILIFLTFVKSVYDRTQLVHKNNVYFRWFFFFKEIWLCIIMSKKNKLFLTTQKHNFIKGSSWTDFFVLFFYYYFLLLFIIFYNYYINVIR